MMFNSKPTKSTVICSVVSLVLCTVLLLGATLAWFTSSVTNTGNIIQTGDVKVSLEFASQLPTAEGDWQDASSGPIFNYTKWEPGYTEVKYIKIENEGSLPFNYALTIVPNDASADALKLAEVIDVYVFNGTVAVTDATVDAATPLGTLADLIAATEGVVAGVLYADAAEGNVYDAYTLALQMQESAGSEYENLNVGEGFAVKVFADTHEKFTGYTGSGSAPAIDKEGGQSAAEISITDDAGNKVGSFVVPADAAEDDAALNVTVGTSTEKPNITVAAGSETITYDIQVEGLKDGNTVPVKVALRFPTDMDPDTVKVYHYDTEIDCTYDPYTGFVTFETATFSPFTVEYDEESDFLPILPEGSTTPVAKVTYEEQYVNTDLPWGSYGQWSPTEGLDSNLEAAFTFACPDYEYATAEEKAIIDAYRYWYCDFYVSLDRDLGANQIFLGGNYGSFGWVGFHNGDLTLEANTEIPLLGSVTSNPWTYNNVEASVGTFICGVGDVDDALDGATFTVKLRLTNPENEAEYYDVNVVTYKFGGDYNIQ